MLHNILVIFHLLGAAVWIGGHIVLVRVIMPTAIKRGDAHRILEFERDFGKIGLIAILVQFITGLILADSWLGGWENIFSHPTPAARLILTKLALLAVTFVLAADATLRVLPRLKQGHHRSFISHAWATTLIAIVLLVLGASIRLGGPVP